jgi:iron complex transport system permease protein
MSILNTKLRRNAVILKLLALLALLLAALLLNLCLGEINLSPEIALQVLFSSDHTGPATAPGYDQLKLAAVGNMVWQIRLPRLLTAAAVGAALAVSGYLLQSLSRNYLADPYLTGVSSGAALAVAVIMLSGVSYALLPLAALLGGLVAAVVVAIMARGPGGLSITRLLLGGVAISAVCSSLITLVMTSFPAGARTLGLFYWLAGSVSGRTWADLQAPALYMTLAGIAALILSKPLRLLSLGSQQAASLGLNVPKMQWSILITAVVLCGASVSLSGVVGFVGLVAPYIGRGVTGTSERWHIIGSALLGATMVLISDLCARCLIPGQELPLGTLLSLVGAPFFLWLIVRHKDEAA